MSSQGQEERASSRADALGEMGFFTTRPSVLGGRTGLVSSASSWWPGLAAPGLHHHAWCPSSGPSARSSHLLHILPQVSGGWLLPAGTLSSKATSLPATSLDPLRPPPSLLHGFHCMWHTDLQSVHTPDPPPPGPRQGKATPAASPAPACCVFISSADSRLPRSRPGPAALP